MHVKFMIAFDLIDMFMFCYNNYGDVKTKKYMDFPKHVTPSIPFYLIILRFLYFLELLQKKN